MVVAPTGHLFDEGFVAFVELGWIDQAIGDVATQGFAPPDAAREHVDFLVLAEQVIAAQEGRIDEPHPHVSRTG